MAYSELESRYSNVGWLWALTQITLHSTAFYQPGVDGLVEHIDMFSVLWALFVGVFVVVGLLPWLPLWQTLPPALGAFVAAFFAFYRFSSVRLKELILSALEGLRPLRKLPREDWDPKEQKERVEQAISKMREIYGLSSWVFNVYPRVDGHIGQILYTFNMDLEKARPYLERARNKDWKSLATLAIIHLKQEQPDKMEEVFEIALLHNRQRELLWLLYADALLKAKRRDKAIEALSRARDELPTNTHLIDNLVALENGMKFKQWDYEEHWKMFWPEDNVKAFSSHERSH